MLNSWKKLCSLEKLVSKKLIFTLDHLRFWKRMALSGAYAAQHAQWRAPYNGGEGAQSLQKAMQMQGRDVLAQGCFFMCAWLLQPHSLPLGGVACCFVLMNTSHQKCPPHNTEWRIRVVGARSCHHS